MHDNAWYSRSHAAHAGIEDSHCGGAQVLTLNCCVTDEPAAVATGVAVLVGSDETVAVATGEM